MSDSKLNFEYMRLSLEDGDVATGKAEESQSIASQRICIRQYRRERADLQMMRFEEVVDDGYSGTHFERPGIKRIMQLVEMGRVGTIIVRDLSRFARNFLEAGYYLEFVFPAHDVRFISINDGYDSAEYGESTAGLHISIKNLVNQMYSQDISRKIKSAVDLKKMNGEFVYGTAPYGYKKGAEKNTIVIDEEAAWVVKKIFDLACSGKTVTEICRYLNDSGISTPSMYLAAVRGKYKIRSFWTYESVRNILSNRIYTGDTEPYKSHVVRVGSDRVKQIPEAERIVIPETHEAIVSRETFFQSRQIIKSNVKTPSKGKASVLSSYIVCGCCGNKLSKGKKQNKTFLCASARYNPESGCKDVRCDEEKTKAILLRSLKQQCMMMEAHVKMIRSAAKHHRSESDGLKADLRFQRRLVEGAQTAKMELYEDFLGGKYTREDYLKKKSELNEKEQSAGMQIALIDEKLKAIASVHSQSEAASEEESMISKYTNITELDDDLMRELVKKIVVYPDGSINIVWNFRDMMQEPDASQVGYAAEK